MNPIRHASGLPQGYLGGGAGRGQIVSVDWVRPGARPNDQAVEDEAQGLTTGMTLGGGPDVRCTAHGCQDWVMATHWVVRSVIAGAAGTAAMTMAYGVERRLRHSGRPLDYDDSLVPGQIVARILDLPSVTGREEAVLGSALRWAYGSAFGLWHGILRKKVDERWASTLFATTLLAATFTAFPLLGKTPPPWQWPGDVLATAVGTHVAYVVGVAIVDIALSPSPRSFRAGDCPDKVRTSRVPLTPGRSHTTRAPPLVTEHEWIDAAGPGYGAGLLGHV